MESVFNKLTVFSILDLSSERIEDEWNERISVEDNNKNRLESIDNIQCWP
jgi:hypothetical protein